MTRVIVCGPVRAALAAAAVLAGAAVLVTGCSPAAGGRARARGQPVRARRGLVPSGPDRGAERPGHGPLRAVHAGSWGPDARAGSPARPCGPRRRHAHAGAGARRRLRRCIHFMRAGIQAKAAGRRRRRRRAGGADALGAVHAEPRHQHAGPDAAGELNLGNVPGITGGFGRYSPQFRRGRRSLPALVAGRDPGRRDRPVRGAGGRRCAGGSPPVAAAGAGRGGVTMAAGRGGPRPRPRPAAPRGGHGPGRPHGPRQHRADERDPRLRPHPAGDQPGERDVHLAAPAG